MESRITETPKTSHYIFCAAANWLTDSRQLAQSSPSCNLSEALFPHFTWGTNRCRETPPPFFIFVFLSVCVEVSSLIPAFHLGNKPVPRNTAPVFFIFVFLSVCVEVSSLYEPNVIATCISVRQRILQYRTKFRSQETLLNKHFPWKFDS
jgi:hypothetical protein